MAATAAGAGAGAGQEEPEPEEDALRLELEAKLARAQAALDERVALLLARRAPGGGGAAAVAEGVEGGAPDGAAGAPGEGGALDVQQLAERRQRLYAGGYAELERVRAIRSQRASAHATYRRPAAVLFRRSRGAEAS